MDVSIERLACRGTVGSLTSPLEMGCELFHRKGMDGSKRSSWVTVAKVIRPTSLPLINLGNHFVGWHKAALRSGQLPNPIPSLRHGLAAGEDVEITVRAAL